MPYRYVDHTADIEFVADGRTLQEAFKNSFLAMFNTSAEIGSLRRVRGPALSVKMHERNRSPEELLWSSLQNAMSIGDSKGIFFYSVKEIGIRESDSGYELRALLQGRKMRPEYSKLEVKGVSRYNLKIRRRKGGYSISVVLDV